LSILIACEESQRVCIEFRKLGFEAYSCDLLPPSGGHPEWHLQQDVLPLLEKPWDLIIAFPPCTYLCSSGMHWTTRGLRDPQLTIDAIEFVTKIWQTDCKYIAIENPIGILSKKIRKPDQIIQPWQFGHGETKATCLWLKNLPLLQPTNIVEGREQRIWKLPPSEDRHILRSKTYPGIAKAMAMQWSKLFEGKDNN
jgi:hypothetical protein